MFSIQQHAGKSRPHLMNLLRVHLCQGIRELKWQFVVGLLELTWMFGFENLKTQTNFIERFMRF